MTAYGVTVKLLLLLPVYYWNVLSILIACHVCTLSSSSWEIKGDNLDAGVKNALKKNIPDANSVRTFNDYGGVVPLSYDLRLRAPVEGNNGVFNELFEGALSVTFLCNRATKYLYLHVKNLIVNTTNVRLTEMDKGEGASVLFKPSVAMATVVDNSFLVVEFNDTLEQRKIYTLTVGKFVGPVQEPNSEGLFFGDVAASSFSPSAVVTGVGAKRRRAHVYVTQFQLEAARTVFPCIDEPRFKVNLTLTLDHFGDYIPLSNAGVANSFPLPPTTEGGNNDTAAADQRSWQRTVFVTTPKLPTYTMAFALLPSSVYVSVTKRNVKLTDEFLLIYCNVGLFLDYVIDVGSRVERNSILTKVLILADDRTLALTVYYNRFRILPNQVALFSKYAEYAYCYFDRQWSFALPLQKLDIAVVPQLLVYGMENFGLITLNEDHVMKSTDDDQFRLIAHEIAHQWLGNLITIDSWSFLCFQEGLTEYYARRVIQDFLASSSQGDTVDWSQRSVFRYLSAMREETEDADATPLIRSNFGSVAQVARQCFNRVPFLIAGLEFLAGIQTLDAKVAQFLRRFAYGAYQFDDFVAIFDNLTVGDRRVSLYLRLWFEKGGYPSLFIRRTYGGGKMNRISLTRKQTLKQHQMQQQHEQRQQNKFQLINASWPMPIVCTASRPISICPNLKLFEEETINFDADLNDSDWIVYNDDFRFFYRVNYDLKNWHLLSNEILSTNSRLSLLTQVQLVNDFCFFNFLNLLFDSASNFTDVAFYNSTVNNFNAAYVQLQNKTGANFQVYITGCSIEEELPIKFNEKLFNFV